MINFTLLFIFFGAGYLTGILVGMLGIGGGLIFVPLLYMFLPYWGIDITQISFLAIGTSLLAGSIAAFSSSLNHLYHKNVDIKKALLLSTGSIISSYLAPFYVVKTKPESLKIILAAVFILAALKMFFENNKKNLKENDSTIHEFYLIFFGIVVGVLAAFAGVGGGILFVPILSFIYFINVRKAVGTSSVVTLFTMLAAAASYVLLHPKGVVVPYQTGYVFLPAALSLGLGAVGGTFMGVRIVLSSSQKLVKQIFAILLIVAVLKLIFKI